MSKLTDKLIELMVNLEANPVTHAEYYEAVSKAVTILDRLDAFTEGIAEVKGETAEAENEKGGEQ